MGWEEYWIENGEGLEVFPMSTQVDWKGIDDMSSSECLDVGTELVGKSEEKRTAQLRL